MRGDGIRREDSRGDKRIEEQRGRAEKKGYDKIR